MHWQIFLGPPESKEYYLAPDGSILKLGNQPGVVMRTTYRIDDRQNAFCFASGGRCMSVYAMANGDYRVVVDNQTFAVVSNVKRGDVGGLIKAYADAKTKTTQPGLPHVVILGFDGKPLPGQHAATEKEFQNNVKMTSRVINEFFREQAANADECSRLGGSYSPGTSTCWMHRR